MSKTQELDISSTEKKKGLLAQGYLNPHIKCIYDMDAEKYYILLLESQEAHFIDKTITIKNLALIFYKELPKGWLELIPTRRLIFDPHRTGYYTMNGIPYQNSFMPTSLFMPNKSKKTLDMIDYSKYPHIKALLDNLFISQDRINYFTNWLSFIINTRKKTTVAILLKGIEGTGKGVLWEEIIQHLIGKNYTHQVSNDFLQSRFNGALENKLFILANEIKGKFTDGNNIYEKVKMYITDNNIPFEDKNVKSRTMTNYFNMLLFSNNETPLQISGTDRRYTVYGTKDRTLKDVALKKFEYENMFFFIKGIREERDKFLKDVGNYAYDENLATTSQDTEEKDKIFQASMTKIEVLSNKIKKEDIEHFIYEIEEKADTNYYNLKDIVDTSKLLYIDHGNDEAKTKEDIIKTLTDNLKEAFKSGIIENSIVILLYRLFVNGEASNMKVGTHLNTHFNKSYVDGKTKKRYRKIKQEHLLNEDDPF